ncbi:MAG: ABC transporter permease [Candidatus Enteromonas sp.]|nr:ABC transporter permease [Candidatus Enteromonas sp.]
MATQNYTYRDSKNVEHTISFSETDLQLIQYDTRLTDVKMKSKPTTFFKDAMKRFAKNKSSVAGAIILGTILALSLFVPVLDTNDISKDNPYLLSQNFLEPKLFNAGTGFWDGTKAYSNTPIDFDWDAYAEDGTYSGVPYSDQANIFVTSAILGDITYSKVGELKLDTVQPYARGGYIRVSTAPTQGDSSLISPKNTYYTNYYNYHVEIEMGDPASFDDFPYGASGVYTVGMIVDGATIPLTDELQGAQKVSIDLADFPTLASSDFTGQISVTLKEDSSTKNSILVKSVVVSATDGASAVNDGVKENLEKVSASDANLTLYRAQQDEMKSYRYSVSGKEDAQIFHADYVVGSFVYDPYEAVYGEYARYDLTKSHMKEWNDKGWIEFDYPLADFLASSMSSSEQARFIAGARLTESGEKYCPLRISEENPLYIKVVGAGNLRAANFGGIVSNYRYYGYSSKPRFIFGTDKSGRDMFKLVFSGLRFSVLLGVITTVINLTIGLIWGAISGYFGGAVDMVMERVSEILGGVPWVVVMTLILINKPDGFPIWIMVGIALCATGWLGTASLTRTQFYRYKDREYILAARTLGARDTRLIFRHILPNAIGTLITSSVLMIPSVIFSEASLSYLHLVNGMQGFGSTLSENQQYMTTQPYLILFPSAVMALIMISFNLFGNGLRDAFNPSLKGGE